MKKCNNYEETDEKWGNYLTIEMILLILLKDKRTGEREGISGSNTVV